MGVLLNAASIATTSSTAPSGSTHPNLGRPRHSVQERSQCSERPKDETADVGEVGKRGARHARRRAKHDRIAVHHCRPAKRQNSDAEDTAPCVPATINSTHQT